MNVEKIDEIIRQRLNVDEGYSTAEFINDEVSNQKLEAANIQLVDKVGGSEGQGSLVYLIFKITAEFNEDYYIKYIGYYDSWNGTSWGDEEMVLVKPIQVTITKYIDKV